MLCFSSGFLVERQKSVSCARAKLGQVGDVSPLCFCELRAPLSLQIPSILEGGDFKTLLIPRVLLSLHILSIFGS